MKKMTFIVKKAVQDYAKMKNVQVSGDFYDALDKQVEKLLDKAAKRTGDNKRKTLKSYDL
jgi:histone H3/H4